MISYQTHDIVLAATLKVLGAQLSEITVTGRQGYFHFENIDKQILVNYDCDKIVVEPKIFNNTLRILASTVKRISDKGYNV